jgi:hypothetical protein
VHFCFSSPFSFYVLFTDRSVDGQDKRGQLPIDRGTKRSVLSISSNRYFAFVENPDLSSQGNSVIRVAVYRSGGRLGWHLAITASRSVAVSYIVLRLSLPFSLYYSKFMVLSMVNNRKLEITMQISFSGFNVALYFASYVYIKRTFNVKSIDSFINVTLKAIIKWPGFDPRPDL